MPSSPGSTGTRCFRPVTSGWPWPPCPETGAVNVGGIMAAEGVDPVPAGGRLGHDLAVRRWGLPVPHRRQPGPGRHRVPGRVPPDGHRAGRRLRRGVPAGRGLGDEPPDPAVRRHDLVRARAAGHLPAAGHGDPPRRASTSTTGAGAGSSPASTPGTINLRYLAPPAAAAADRRRDAGRAGRAWPRWPPGSGGPWPLARYRRAGRPAAVRGVRAGRVGPGRAAACRRGPRRACPLVLATMHMSWGAGFLTSPRDLVSGPAGRRETPVRRAGRLRGALRGR